MLARFVALILATATVAPSQANMHSEESVARFCLSAASVWSTASEDIPKFAGNSPPQRGVESYWRHSFRDVSVPIPIDTDGWYFWLSDSNYVKNLAGLAHENLKISYGLEPSQMQIGLKGVRDLANELGLPSANSEPMELIQAALKIDPEQVECNPNDVQETVDNLSAVYIKAFVLKFHDKAYLHGDGVLGHSVMNIGERWTYLFKNESGQLYEINLRHENPGRYPYIGFEIDDKVLMDSMYSPPWMPLFFEAASDPTKERLVHLREFIIDYALPAGTYEALDEKIAQYE